MIYNLSLEQKSMIKEKCKPQFDWIDRFEEFLDTKCANVCILGYEFKASSILRKCSPFDYSKERIDFFNNNYIKLHNNYYKISDVKDLLNNV
jgi:hypothetical protein